MNFYTIHLMSAPGGNSFQTWKIALYQLASCEAILFIYVPSLLFFYLLPGIIYNYLSEKYIGRTSTFRAKAISLYHEGLNQPFLGTIL
jgi:hypothetical protein